jgi:hypothetical protein
METSQAVRNWGLKKEDTTGHHTMAILCNFYGNNDDNPSDFWDTISHTNIVRIQRERLPRLRGLHDPWDPAAQLFIGDCGRKVATRD